MFQQLIDTHTAALVYKECKRTRTVNMDSTQTDRKRIFMITRIKEKIFTDWNIFLSQMILKNGNANYYNKFNLFNLNINFDLKNKKTNV